MKEEFNSQAFTPEEVKQGLHMDLIMYLLDYNSKAEQNYNDIHITSDGYCTIVEWSNIPYSGEYGGKFKYVEEAQVIMTEYLMPDNSIILCHDEDDYQDQLTEFLHEEAKNGLHYEKNQYGHWYCKEEQEALRELIGE